MMIPPIFTPTLENREHLANLLRNPVLIAALRQITEDVSIPQSVLHSQVAELISRRAAFREGRATALEALVALTRPQREHSPTPEPWEHVETEHIKA
jgi:hypothetical protein